MALLVPPIGIFAAWVYYRNGFVDVKMASLIAVGFFLGGFIGARLAVMFSSSTLEKVFGVTLILIGLKMVFVK